jgi:hypothetical protein
MFSRPDGSCRLEGYCTADVAKHCAGDDARFLAVLLSRTGAIEAYSTTQRCFTDQQRHAMTARDRGCTFPGCNRPPGWGQTHHVTEHRTPDRPPSTTACCSADTTTEPSNAPAAPCRSATASPGRPRWLDPTNNPSATPPDHGNA